MGQSLAANVCCVFAFIYDDDWLALLNSEIRSPKVQLPLVQFGGHMCLQVFDFDQVKIRVRIRVLSHGNEFVR